MYMNEPLRMWHLEYTLPIAVGAIVTRPEHPDGNRPTFYMKALDTIKFLVG
jgi:hypothetical protein